MKQTVRYGSQPITYELSFHPRRTLGITVTPTPSVLVRAPEGTSLEAVKEKVIKRAPWILRQLDFFRHFLPKLPPKRYVGGETHLYLGRQYRLKIVASSDSTVKLKGRYLEVRTPYSNQAKPLVQAWYRQRARVKLHQVADRWIVRFRQHGVSPSSVILLQMSHRWGSCTPQGKILLNPTLVQAPVGCIEYVVVHELCHLVHPHHTARFYCLQSQEFPHWQKWKDKLEHLPVAE